MDSTIQIEHIEIKFGDFVAIKDLSLTINKGEFFTFLGPSGCGKTTTLRALAGFITPTKGKIIVNGEDITHKPIEKRGIGMVFQSYALFPTMTVRQNITFGLEENKWEKSRIDKRVQEVAAMVNLTEEQLNKNVSALSGGQQQRVAIARALALEPEIIVLDEPLSNLDAKLRKSLRMDLKRIQKTSGTTMIYVTHDQEEALTLSDQIAVFNNGYIAQVGTPREIYSHPANEFVTTFVGDAALLGPDDLAQLVNENADFKPEPNRRYYIRSENVHPLRDGEDSTDYYLINGEFFIEEFYGNTSRRTYRIGNDEIRSTEVINNTLHGQPGEVIPLKIRKGNLISFEVE